jgi:RNA polymerase sigma-70 factor (ECF subfamily)
MNELQKLLDSVRGGDRTAFETVYETLKTLLFTIILRITHDRALSEDILQEVFIKLYLTPPEPSANPRAYICRMARNLAIDSVRQRKPSVELEEAENSLYHPIDDLSLKMDTENAILALPDKERQIVTLHINGDLKFREVADILGIPLGTVLWSYQKAIKQLRNTLEV